MREPYGWSPASRAARLRRLANRLDARAQQRQDPRLAELARQARIRASDIETGPLPDTHELTDSLGRRV